MNIAYPFQLDRRGRIATVSDADHIRDMIEELLFTSPGERVNRPDFGSGLQQLIFTPDSPELAATLQFTMQAAIQRWLGDLISLNGLSVVAQDSTISVQVQYVIRASNTSQTALYTQTV